MARRSARHVCGSSAEATHPPSRCGSSAALPAAADYSAAEFGDALFSVFAHLPLSEVFVPRGVCREWRRSIDDCTSNSLFWRSLACAHAGGHPPSDAATPLAAGTWEAVARILARSPLPSFQKRLMQQKDVSATPLFAAEEMCRLLEALVVMGELAVVDCPQTPQTRMLNPPSWRWPWVPGRLRREASGLGCSAHC